MNKVSYKSIFPCRGKARSTSSALAETPLPRSENEKRRDFYTRLLSVDIVSPVYCSQSFGEILNGIERLYTYMPAQENSEWTVSGDRVVEERIYRTLAFLGARTRENYYDAHFFAQLACLLQNLVLSEIPHAQRYTLAPGTGMVSANTAQKNEGVYLNSGLFSPHLHALLFPRGGSQLFTLHAGEKESNIPLTNEAIVGLYALNELRDFFPTFQYVYAAFRAPAMDMGEGAVFSDGAYTTYTLVERLDGHVPLAEWLADSQRTAGEIHEVLTQIFLALGLAQKKFGFSHNNLKMSNVFVRTSTDPVKFFYPDGSGSSRGHLLTSRHIAKITNFVHSRVALPTGPTRSAVARPLLTGKYDEKHGYTPERSNNHMDIAAFLLEICTLTKSVECTRKYFVLPDKLRIDIKRPEVFWLLHLCLGSNMGALVDLISSSGSLPFSESAHPVDIDVLSETQRVYYSYLYAELANASALFDPFSGRGGRPPPGPYMVMAYESGRQDASPTCPVNDAWNSRQHCLDIRVGVNSISEIRRTLSSLHPHGGYGSAAERMTRNRNLDARDISAVQAAVDEIFTRHGTSTVRFAPDFMQFSRKKIELEIIKLQKLEAMYGPLFYNDRDGSTVSSFMHFAKNADWEKEKTRFSRNAIIFGSLTVLLIAFMYMAYADSNSLAAIEYMPDGNVEFSAVPELASEMTEQFMSTTGATRSGMSEWFGSLTSFFTGRTRERINSSVNADLNVDYLPSVVTSGSSRNASFIGRVMRPFMNLTYAFLDWIPLMGGALSILFNWCAIVLFQNVRTKIVEFFAKRLYTKALGSDMLNYEVVVT
jgi:hypothetical protein